MGGGHKRFRGIFVAAIFILAGAITVQHAQAFSPHSCHENQSCDSSGHDFSGPIDSEGKLTWRLHADIKNSVTITAVTEDGETLTASGALMCHEAVDNV